jgi:hypothetical protein
MFKKTLIGTLAAFAIAAGAVGAATPANARAALFSISVGPTLGPSNGPHECWQWSRDYDWSWTCRLHVPRSYNFYA